MTQAYTAGFALSVFGRIFPNKEQGIFIDFLKTQPRKQ